MSTWKGISHGRTTRAMERSLLPAEFKVVATVRRLIPDGQRRRIPQAEIAAKAKVSEGTVSRTMRKVEGIFFRRHFLGKGRGGGFEIEALAPPEQLQLPLPAPEKGSLTDPSPESFLSGVPTPQTPPEKGSLTDPSIFMSHAHEQQQQGGSVEQGFADDRAAGQLAPETIQALADAGAHPKLIARVAAHNPRCTPADVAAALEAAPKKPNSHTPPGLALEALALGQQVIVPRAPGEAPTSAPKRPGRRVPPAEEAAALAASFAALAAEQAAERAAAPAWRPPTPYQAPAAPPAPPDPPPLVPRLAFDPSQRGSKRPGVAVERARAQRKPRLVAGD